MKNVVVPVDFSETSASAVRFGIYLADLMDLNLQIVFVTDLVLSGEHRLTTPEQKKDEKVLEERLARFAQENVDYATPTKRSNNPVTRPAVNLSVLSGGVASRILSLSREEQTALIVMGGVGMGAGIHPPGWYGSVATPVALRGGCPVILIPKGYRSHDVNRLAIAFDDVEEITQISKFSRSIVEALRPEVRFVHVRKANWQEKMVTEDALVALTRAKGISSDTFAFDVLPPGNVVDQLTQYTKDKQINLLVLGGKRQGFWRRLFDKHHLKPVIRAAEVPMLIIPFSTSEE